MPTGSRTAEGAHMAWRVTFDQQACSICEICVHKCPQQALLIRHTGDLEEILFDDRLCDGCAGKMVCRDVCPEHAVTVTRVRVAGPSEAPVVLVQGTLSSCQSCGTRFVPERKIETLVKGARITAKDVQGYCPACRRTRLLDALLEARVEAELGES